MAIGYANLNQHVKGLINGNYPDIGQVHYVVDSNYRTHAQGWSRADGTGPIDLYNERMPGYVFYTPEDGSPNIRSYSTVAAAIQGAIDALVDFRGDTVFFTPGAYAPATALTVDVANARYLGPPVLNARRAAVTITDGVGDLITTTAAADDMEWAFIKFVPFTAQNIFNLVSGTDRGFLHHCYYDTTGVTADTATEFFNGASQEADWLIQNCYHRIDALHGDCYTLAAALRWVWEDCIFLTEVASYASVFTFTAASMGNMVRRCYFLADADGTYTNIFTGAANQNQQLLLDEIVVSGTALATATAIETTFGTTTDIEIARCWQTGDATLEGGVEIALA